MTKWRNIEGLNVLGACHCDQPSLLIALSQLIYINDIPLIEVIWAIVVCCPGLL